MWRNAARQNRGTDKRKSQIMRLSRPKVPQEAGSYKEAETG